MALHPGKHLAKLIKPERKKDFAKRLGVSTFTLWKLLNERQRVEPKMAQRLAKATGKDTAYWLKLQMDHDVERHG
jgi:addiction module HigA family antidote